MRVTAAVVTCTYCGKEARVQRRTQLFQRPIDLPSLGASQPRAVAVQQRNPARWIVVGMVITSAVIAFVVFAAAPHVGPSVFPPSRTTGASSAFWTTKHPLLDDLDGDGLEDAIGIVRRTGGRDGVYLRAVSGRSGKALWETPALGTYEQNDRLALALASGFVLVADTEYKPHLDAYDASTGTKRWSITPSEVVMDLCQDRAGRVKLVTKDERETSIELATGTSTPLSKPSKCVQLPSTEHRHVTIDTNNPHWGFAPPGMASYEIAGDPSSWILSGHKSPGSQIPMIAVIDDHEHVKWQAVVASTDPLSSKWPIDQAVAYDTTLVATVYGRKDDKQSPVLVAFDRDHGTRLFETTLTRTAGWYLTGITLEVGPTAVWLALDDAVRAYDRKTGALRWRMAE